VGVAWLQGGAVIFKLFQYDTARAQTSCSASAVSVLLYARYWLCFGSGTVLPWLASPCNAAVTSSHTIGQASRPGSLF
jgi:hypothetical protein